jgi:protein gp37
MNKQGKGKIEWCDKTLNYARGCKRDCTYCYARKIHNRFCDTPFSEITYYPERLKQLKIKKAVSIFLDSMSDYEYWSDEACAGLLEAINNNPQHNYILLTKGKVTFASGYKNIFNGLSVDTQKQFDNNYGYCFDFLSIEPILEPINISAVKYLKQIIIGAETGNRKGKIIPKKEWIDSLCEQADECGIKVFMKDSLIPIVGEENMRRELIWRK